MVSKTILGKQSCRIVLLQQAALSNYPVRGSLWLQEAKVGWRRKLICAFWLGFSFPQFVKSCRMCAGRSRFKLFESNHVFLLCQVNSAHFCKTKQVMYLFICFDIQMDNLLYRFAWSMVFIKHRYKMICIYWISWLHYPVQKVFTHFAWT